MPISLLAPLVVALFLSGCAPAPGLRSIIDLGGELANRSKNEPVAGALNPAFRYLRVQSDGRVAYFVLGYLDPHPDGLIEVWYSGEREVLRLQRGRIVGVTGTEIEWPAVKLIDAPAWSVDMNATSFQRVRDVLPGYRFGIQETMQIQAIKPPKKTALQQLSKADLFWFEETAISKATTGVSTLPPTLYALKQDQGNVNVVYAETCLAKNLCFSWQRWQP